MRDRNWKLAFNEEINNAKKNGTLPSQAAQEIAIGLAKAKETGYYFMAYDTLLKSKDKDVQEYIKNVTKIVDNKIYKNVPTKVDAKTFAFAAMVQAGRHLV